MQEAVSILKLYAEENSMDEENSKPFFHSIATLMSNMLREVSLTVKNLFIEQFTHSALYVIRYGGMGASIRTVV